MTGKLLWKIAEAHKEGVTALQIAPNQVIAYGLARTNPILSTTHPNRVSSEIPGERWRPRRGSRLESEDAGDGVQPEATPAASHIAGMMFISGVC